MVQTEITDETLLENYEILGHSEAFMRFLVPLLLKQHRGLLRELYLLAMIHPLFRKDLELFYRGHVSSGKIQRKKTK
jgi:hypothetical protein